MVAAAAVFLLVTFGNDGCCSEPNNGAAQAPTGSTVAGDGREIATNDAMNKITVGSGNFEFVDTKGNADRPLKVWFYRPKAWTATSPIVFVMHGVTRAADRYCREWTDLAEKSNFIVVCPQFLKKDYPSEAYQRGNMFDAQKQPIPYEKWTFTAIEHLFDEVKGITGSTSREYYLYGHSAGGQFVQRFVLFMPHARYKRAIAANPGWYTMPVYTEHTYPYGLRDSGLKEDDLKKSLSRSFVLMLGESDVDPSDPELNQSKKAEEQGLTRFQRGQNFFKSSQAEARSLGVDMHWLLRTVPDAHHSDREMGVAAAPVLFE